MKWSGMKIYFGEIRIICISNDSIELTSFLNIFVWIE